MLRFPESGNFPESGPKKDFWVNGFTITVTLHLRSIGPMSNGTWPTSLSIHSATHSSQANASVRSALILCRRGGGDGKGRRRESGGGGKEEEEEKPPSLEWFVLICSSRVKPVYYILHVKTSSV